MARRGDADSQTAREKIHDRARARVGFSGARRTLHEEIALVEQADEVRELLRRRRAVVERRALGTVDEARRVGTQQVARGAKARRTIVTREFAREAHERILLRLGVHRTAGAERARQGPSVELCRLLEHERTGGIVDRHELARRLIRPNLGIEHVARFEFVFLRWKLQRETARAVEQIGLPRRHFDCSDRFGILDQIFGRLAAIEPVEERPPGGPRLAFMICEQLRGEPARAFVFVRRFRIDAERELRGDAVEFRVGFHRLRFDRAAPRNLRVEERGGFPLALDEPAVEVERGITILAIVLNDLRECGRVARFQEALVHHDRGHRARDLVAARPAIELLDLLERVALERRAQPLPHDVEEIDEHAFAQQHVDVGFARAVFGREPAQRRGFIGRVVVNVQVRPLRPPREDEIDQRLERAFLAGAIVAVERDEATFARFVDGGDAEEILERTAFVERVALDVEIEIARIGLRESREPATLLGPQQLVARDAVGARFHLKRCLRARLRERPRLELRRTRRVRRLRERRDRHDARLVQLDRLAATDAGHQTQVIVGSAARFADGVEPATPLAVRDGIRVRRPARVRAREKPFARRANVRQRIFRAERFDAAVAEDHVHPLRQHALLAREQFRVHAHLHERRRFRGARELRVANLVVIVAEVRRAVDPDREIGHARPARTHRGQVHERGTVDRLRAVAHRQQRIRGGDAAAIE